MSKGFALMLQYAVQRAILRVTNATKAFRLLALHASASLGSLASVFIDCSQTAPGPLARFDLFLCARNARFSLCPKLSTSFSGLVRLHRLLLNLVSTRKMVLTCISHRCVFHLRSLWNTSSCEAKRGAVLASRDAKLERKVDVMK
jgi:hypothetical protein